MHIWHRTYLYFLAEGITDGSDKLILLQRSTEVDSPLGHVDRTT